jgi:small subunit ribosomal protein S4
MGISWLNGRRNDIASTILKPGDQIAVREISKKNEYFKTLRQAEEMRTPQAWVEVDLNNLSGRMITFTRSC